jgi:hypothetical protein
MPGSKYNMSLNTCPGSTPRFITHSEIVSILVATTIKAKTVMMVKKVGQIS